MRAMLLLSQCAELPLGLRTAEHEVLYGFSRSEGDGGLWGGEHAPELRDLAREQTVHDASDTTLEQAEAGRVLDLVLQPTHALRHSADDVRRRSTGALGRRFCSGP